MFQFLVPRAGFSIGGIDGMSSVISKSMTARAKRPLGRADGHAGESYTGIAACFFLPVD